MSLGLPVGEVRVVSYDAEWPRLFEEEARRVREAMGDAILAVHHIGSTSVPGLAAKPILDLLPVARRIELLDDPGLVRRMEALGYEAMGEFGLPGRRYFRKGPDRRTHHVHAYAEGHPDVARHLAFRDYLRAHPEEARAYAELKLELARRFPDDQEAYMDGKDAWIKAAEERALAWWRSRSDADRRDG
ncbi:MAG: GrpB family protein [Clostridia bacterium]|nr:GrpB family protein [Clostridia bacterium]